MCRLLNREKTSILRSLSKIMTSKTCHQLKKKFFKEKKEGKGGWGELCPLWNTKDFQFWGIRMGVLGEKNVLACGNEVKKKTAKDDYFSPSRLLYPHKLRQWSAC